MEPYGEEPRQEQVEINGINVNIHIYPKRVYSNECVAVYWNDDGEVRQRLLSIDFNKILDPEYLLACLRRYNRLDASEFRITKIGIIDN